MQQIQYIFHVHSFLASTDFNFVLWNDFSHTVVLQYCTVVEKRNAAKECFSSHVRLDISELLAWYFAREGFVLPFRIFKFGGKGRVCSESGSRHGLSTVQWRRVSVECYRRHCLKLGGNEVDNQLHNIRRVAPADLTDHWFVFEEHKQRPWALQGRLAHGGLFKSWVRGD